MVKNIAGASNVTEYQLVRFSQTNKVFQDDVLNLYIKYALEFNVQVDVAYGMCLLYTDFFRNEIIGNNLVGIGVQLGGTKMEKFNSIEDCIIAHYQILQKISSDNAIEKPISNLYRRCTNKSCVYSTDVYTLFEYDKLTKYNIYEFSTFIREINRTRKESSDWVTSSKYYYFIRIKSSKNKTELIKLRSDLINKKFDQKILFITANNGIYTLEAGRYASPVNTNTILRNLQMFGYNGEIEYRKNE